LELGDRRSAIIGALGLRHRRRVNPPHRTVCGATRRSAQPRLRRRAGRSHPRGDVLRARGAGVARLRIRHSVSPGTVGKVVAAGPGPIAGLCPTRPGVAVTVKAFVVPDLGEGLEEVTLSSWNVAVGDDVELNQPLCSVETAKAEVEIPSPYAGRIVEIRGAAGDVLEVGSLLVRIDTGPAAAGTSNGESPTRTP